MFNDPEFLKLAIGAVTALIGAAWTAYVYFDKRGRQSRTEKLGTNQSTVIINSLPRGAVVLMLAGVVLIGFVLMTAEEGGDQINAGDGSAVATGDGASATANSDNQTNTGDVSATNGVAAGRDISGNTITITNGK